MADPEPTTDAVRLLLVRHGETEWSRTLRHTGRTDVPLTDTGRDQARRLAPVLAARAHDHVLTSPLQRAAETAALAGLDRGVEVVDDLREWDYGDDEGRTTAELRESRPDWTVWSPGPTGGETVADVGARCDRVMARCQALGGVVVLVSHGHLLRVLAARWLGLAPTYGRHLEVEPAAWSLLGHERETPTIEHWNVPVDR